MTVFQRYFLPATLIASLALCLAACATNPEEIEEGLSPAEYFQRAQEASDASRYKLALAYYQKFQEEYPEELERNLWASYEIALLYHKMGQNRTALELFDALLAEYAAAGDASLPQGPKILAEKVKARIEEQLQGEQPGPEEEAPGVLGGEENGGESGAAESGAADTETGGP
jgi:tetratricopeptide (TPR) repeat protein